MKLTLNDKERSFGNERRQRGKGSGQGYGRDALKKEENSRTSYSLRG